MYDAENIILNVQYFGVVTVWVSVKILTCCATQADACQPFVGLVGPFSNRNNDHEFGVFFVFSVRMLRTHVHTRNAV